MERIEAEGKKLKLIMLITRSKINVKDNSGITLVQCIQIQKSKKNKKPCKIGGFLKAAIKKGNVKSLTRGLKSNAQRLKKLTGPERLHDLVVIQTRKSLRRLDGSAIRFNANSAVTVNSRRLPLFKRVNGLVPFEVKKACSPLLSLAKNLI